MFDKTFIAPARDTHHHHSKTVHEHRAPTDESVRLLNEMRAAAERNRVAGFHMEGNEFHGRVEVFEMMDPPSKLARAYFDLNGKRMTAEARADWRDQTPEALALKLRDEVARVIAGEILSQALRGVRL